MSFEYINAQDKITPRYNEVTLNTGFDGNKILIVRVDTEQGFFDTNGNYTQFPKACYDKDFFEGFAEIEENGKFGFIDIEGRVITEPKYDNVGQFSDGVATARLLWNEKVGYINKNGEYVLSPKYLAAGHFSEGIAPVKVKVHGREKWGYINKKGDFVIEPKYSSAHSFINGKALVTFDRKTVYIDLMGNALGSVSDPYIDFYDGLRQCCINKKYGYVNKSGEIAIEPQFTVTTNFSEGLAGVKKKGEKYGFIDTLGNYAISPKFENVGRFSQGLCEFKKGRKYGFIDKLGDVVIKPYFDHIATPFLKNGSAIVANDRKHGIIEQSGEWVVPPMFDRIWPFENDIFTVRIGDKLDVIRIIK